MSTDFRVSLSSPLLRLPRELRDIIYLCLPDDRRHPPEDPDQAISAGNRIQYGTTFYESSSPRPPLLQLKLVCHMMYAEVIDVLHKHTRYLRDNPRLDVMVRGTSIWPTWTCLPVTPRLSPLVEINLRFFDASTSSEFNTGAYRSLWSLLNMLVFRGPCFIHNTSDFPAPLQFKKLRFDVWLGFPASPDDFFYRVVFDRLKRLALDDVGLGNVERIAAWLGGDMRDAGVWNVSQVYDKLIFARRIGY